tara:strand:- start:289500 stop:290378 length:879 start_codon:yes stop_codon:yes gene_type:complete
MLPIFTEAVAGLSLLRALNNLRLRIFNRTVDTLPIRFIRLFESHGVHRNQISRFFGHGLTLADVQTDASLLAKLNDSMLDDACRLFGVRREWLDGADDQIYQQHHFYKYPKDFIDFIASLKFNNPEGQFEGMVFAPDTDVGDDEAVLIIRESVGFIEDRTIYRFYICDTWVFVYWKCRAYLTACIAIAWKNSIYVQGRYIPRKYIEKIISGTFLLASAGDYVFSDKATSRWHPEDMALYPKAFLHRIDPERDNFGIQAALSTWVELSDQGFMDTGIGEVDAKSSFKNELQKR